MSKKKILIIDDDPDIRDSIKAILESNDFDANAAKDVKDGLSSLNSFNPDLVLCDMMMEQIDSGTQAALEIKKQKPHLPIYLLSSIGSATANNIDIDQLGFNGVFQKPVVPEVLVNTIRKVLKIN